ncbi:hypothetical protein ACIP5Y_47295 [Nocardia sp. NPDC088792]|uniref:hypothetical protein n=1 Tax=Nocardia sp. NPDC088792 TaxID=3364332 RepID=UPI003802F5E3
MTKALLAIHVLAAIIAIGPVTVAASMYPAAARHATGVDASLETVRVLHRICRVYAFLGLVVPVVGFGLAQSMNVLGSAWVITSIVLTVAAALILGLLILPAQDAVLTTLTGARTAGVAVPDLPTAARLAMLTGIFNLLWATVTILMIVRPGSTTGV